MYLCANADVALLRYGHQPKCACREFGMPDDWKELKNSVQGHILTYHMVINQNPHQRVRKLLSTSIWGLLILIDKSLWLSVESKSSEKRWFWNREREDTGDIKAEILTVQKQIIPIRKKCGGN